MKFVSLDHLAEKTFSTFKRFPLAIVSAFIGSLFFIKRFIYPEKQIQLIIII